MKPDPSIIATPDRPDGEPLTATELLRRGRTDEIWARYCGFLDLTVEDFMARQYQLLEEQIARLNAAPFSRELMGCTPADAEEFRQRVPFTTYANYAPVFGDRIATGLPEEPVAWVHTSGRSGEY